MSSKLLHTTHAICIQIFVLFQTLAPASATLTFVGPSYSLRICPRANICSPVKYRARFSHRDQKTQLLSSNNDQGVNTDILSVLQTLDTALNEAIRREEYDVASRLKRQIEEMRRDASLGS